MSSDHENLLKRLSAQFKDEDSVLFATRFIDFTKDNGAKPQILVLVLKKQKLKVLKLKENLVVVKSWAIEDIKSIENTSDDLQLAVVISKPYLWTFEDKFIKIEFLQTVIKVSVPS